MLCGLLDVGKGLPVVNSDVRQENEARERVVLGRRSAALLTASSFSRYVYIPAGGSQHGPLGALFSTAMTFAFVSFWHGGNDYLWCWATLNWLGVTVENGVQKLVQRPHVQHSLVSRSWLVRQGAKLGGLGLGAGAVITLILGHSCRIGSTSSVFPEVGQLNKRWWLR